MAMLILAKFMQSEPDWSVYWFL